MSIQLQRATTQPDQTVTFQFDEPITRSAVGLSYFQLSYGRRDHHVRSMSISLSVSQDSPTQISVTARAILDDDSGNGIDLSASELGLVCIGAGEDDQIALANRNNIPSGGRSTPIQVDFEPQSQSAALAGFSLSYGQEDHHLERASALAALTPANSIGAAINAGGTAVAIRSYAEMSDDSGNHSAIASIDGGYAGIGAGCGVQVASLGQTQSSAPVAVTFPTPLTDAVALIQGWRVEFEKANDHHVQTITAGTTSLVVNENVVQLSNAQATLRDNSGHVQDNAVSGVDLLIVALS